MYLASALRFVSPKANIKCSLTRIEPQVFFFLEGVLKRLPFGREFIACQFESPVQSANGRNIAGQQVETTPIVFQDVTCCIGSWSVRSRVIGSYARLLTLLHVIACFWELLHRLHTTCLQGCLFLLILLSNSYPSLLSCRLPGYSSSTYR